MLLFTAWFSAYSIALHDAHLTHKADLGQIDLAIWNTAQGRLLQEIKDETISTRLTDHVEPIFVPVSLVFWLWDDVRALLILQAAALAAGAWPVYLLARKRAGDWGLGIGDSRAAGESQYPIPNTRYPTYDWVAVIFAVAYLLAPALQAGAVAEFHAFPFAAPLIAWALWAVEDRRWGEFVIAGVLLAGVQEGMALLTTTLGLYAIARGSGEQFAKAKSVPDRSRGFRWFGACATDRLKARLLGFSPPALAAGVTIALFGLAWFYLATFVIIPHYASLAYGLAVTPYAARFGAVGDSFGDVLKALLTQPLTVLRIVVEPLRLRYLAGLLWPTAFLALLGPEILLLSLPMLLANLLSGYALQYSGELHYSTPLVPFVVVAAIFGFERLLRRFEFLRQGSGIRDQGSGVRGQGSEGSRLSPDSWFLIPALGLLLAALGYQIAAGYLPIGREFWRRGWPQVTAHDRLLDRFAAQIPREAALSAATDLYPHLSHREQTYQFPWLGEATWALVDVTGTTDRHPNDVQAAIRKLLAGGWGVVDAADGYILLAQGRGSAVLPDAFYDFARAPAAQPQYELDITFGDRLKLLGYDVLDDVKWRRTGLRFYWQALAPLSPDTAIAVQVLTPDGGVADDTAVRPMPALLWYPPARWQAGETLVTETLPWYLPREWAPVVTVSHVPGTSEVSGTWVGLAWTRREGTLVPLKDPNDPFQIAARFSDQGWSVRLTGWAAAMAVAPGKNLPVALRWQVAGPAPKDYTVFLHLRDAAGKTVATGDGTPTWFVPLPTSGWPPGGLLTWDGHLVAVPAGLPEGRYDLVAGWYDWQTGERLAAYDEGGNLLGDEFVLGPVTVHPAAGPRPDLACLLAAESCASLE
ncbi:MAG: DUF2079 domain-containing protein [Chloroflexi bacterium]|nr:DUF2079 domain-containing protein [Chloroflexota bacterium]